MKKAIDNKNKNGKIRFNHSKFWTSFGVWFLGVFISFIPSIIAYFNLLEAALPGDKVIGYFEYVTTDPNILYNVVSLIVIAFSDIILDLFQRDTKFREAKSVISFFCMLTMVFAASTFGSATGWDKSFKVLPFLTIGFFVCAVLECIAVYIMKSLESSKKKGERT